MRSAAVVAVVAVGLATAIAEPKAKARPKPTPTFLQKLFAPKKSATPKITRRSIPKKNASKIESEPKPRPRPVPTECACYIVDAEWMAHYRVLEAIWSYPIPEDADIRFENGKYMVPTVVYRHYEDMMKTPRPETINSNEIVTDPIASLFKFGYFRPGYFVREDRGESNVHF